MFGEGCPELLGLSEDSLRELVTEIAATVWMSPDPEHPDGQHVWTQRINPGQEKLAALLLSFGVKPDTAL